MRTREKASRWCGESASSDVEVGGKVLLRLHIVFAGIKSFEFGEGKGASGGRGKRDLLRKQTERKKDFSRDAKVKKKNNFFYLIRNSNNTLNISRDTRKIYFCWTNRRCHPPDFQKKSRAYWVNLIYMIQSDRSVNVYIGAQFFSAGRNRKLLARIETLSKTGEDVPRGEGRKEDRKREKLDEKKFIRQFFFCSSELIQRAKIINSHKKTNKERK